MIGDVSGAFADLGTFIPLVSGVILVGHLDPVRILVGFGLFALATGFIYRRPMPVQPMKAVAALVITGSLSVDVVTASGLLIGIVLIGLALTGSIERLQALVPRTVLQGVQLGLGFSLVLSAARLPGANAWIGAGLLAALLAAQLTVLRRVGALALLVGGVSVAIASGVPAPASGAFAWSSFAFHLPAWPAFAEASYMAVLPQLALTLTNAVLLTALLAADYFPQSRDRITARNLALSSGGLNAVLAPFGALPMCHGAGGLAVQYAQGARTGLMPVLFGSVCVMLAIVAGPNAIAWLELVPAEVIAALLAYAGVQLMSVHNVVRDRPDALVVIFATGFVSLIANVAVGLLVGIAIARGLDLRSGR